MSYIKINHSNLQQVPENYTYLIELNNNGSFERGMIIDIDKNIQLSNKVVCGNSSGTLWQWLEVRNYCFSNDEIEKYKIFKEEFDKKWYKSILAER